MNLLANRCFASIRATLSAGAVAAAVVVSSGTAMPVFAQPNIVVNTPGGMPSDPGSVEDLNAAMEDAFADMDFDMGEMMNQAMGSPNSAPISEADLNRFMTILEFTADQREAASTIFKQRFDNFRETGKDYPRQMQDMMNAMMKKVSEAMQAGDMGGANAMADKEYMTKAAELEAKIKKNKEDLETGVLADLKDLLSKPQEALWPKVEMTRRRETAMRSQLLMMTVAAKVDLRQVAERYIAKHKDTPAAAVASVNAALDDHEAKIDPMFTQIIEMQTNAEKGNDEVREKMGKGDAPDIEKMMAPMRELPVIAQRLRRANLATANVIADALPAEQHDGFLGAYQAAAFPSTFRPMHSEKVLGAALQIDDLRDDQRAKLTEMQTAQITRLAQLRQAVVKEAVEAADAKADAAAKGEVNAMDMFMPSMGSVAKQELRTADNDTVKQVRTMLTDEQREKLPKRQKPANPMKFEVSPDGGPPQMTIELPTATPAGTDAAPTDKPADEPAGKPAPRPKK